MMTSGRVSFRLTRCVFDETTFRSQRTVSNFCQTFSSPAQKALIDP